MRLTRFIPAAIAALTLLPEAASAQQVQFLKNTCIAGGLLTLAAWGPGPWSLDARRGQA